mgnify:CR=1 FL=1
MKIKLFTDGGCRKNGIGGWGVVFVCGDVVKEVYGGTTNTTNNKMELTSVIEALKRVKRRDIPIKVYSDSAYIVNCFNDKWYVKWRRNGWINSRGQPVENKDLWEELINLVESFDSIEFVKVKGHSGVEFNERADQLANQGIEELLKEVDDNVQ